jgi:beta-glucosidase
MSIDRRHLLTGTGALLAASLLPRSHATTAKPVAGHFPAGFLWGTATAGHQVEGNNTASDLWLLEHVSPTPFAEPSGDAVNSFELWPRDLDLVRSLGLNSYRFSLEWARIEPEPGQFSVAMLDHYKSMIDGCQQRGLTAMVTFNHFSAPRWFAALGGWTNAQAPALFARYCERAARHLAAGIGYATTLNEPNLLQILRRVPLPPAVWELGHNGLAAAARACGTAKFVAANVASLEDIDAMQPNMLAGHKAGRAAIKAVRPELPVGVSLAMLDDQAVGANSLRDARRAELYGAWLEAVREDDFLGVQNYERARYDAQGRLPPPAGAALGSTGMEIYPPSLGNAVRYAHAATGLPIIVTEHGLATDNDALRAAFIPDSLRGLAAAIAEGIAVKGYVHWSLLDNFEWIFGFGPKLGLVAVDRATFKRTPKPSAGVLAAIARRNAV